MKLFRHIALSAILTTGIFGSFLYTSCDKDKCKDVVCNNGGTCKDGTCTCVAGYEGTKCETESRTKFVKTWSADETTSGSVHLVYSTSIVGGGTDVTKVTIGNSFNNSFFTNVINASVSGNTITITSQAPDADAYTVSGTGTYTSADGKIAWNYTITKTDVTPNAVVTVTGTWQ